MKKRVCIFWILFLSYTTIYIARLNLSVATPELKTMALADAAQIGILGSVFSVVYAVGRLLNGSIGDRLPPYAMICTGLGLCAGSNLLLGGLPTFWGMALLWGCNAFGQSMLWSSILRILAALYDKEKVGKMTSYMVTAVAVGNILGILLGTVLVTRWGVRFAFVVPGAMAVIFGLLVWVFTGKLSVPAAEKSVHVPVYRLLQDPAVRKELLPAFLHGAIKDNISLWMTVYVVEQFQVDLGESAAFVLFIPAMGFIGRIAYAAVYRLCRQKEDLVSALSFLLCLAAAVALCFSRSMLLSVAALGCIYAAVSLANTSFLSIFPLRFAQSGNISSVSGFMDFGTYLGAGAGSLLYGALIKSFGYLPMFISWAVIAAVCGALLLSFARKETRAAGR